MLVDVAQPSGGASTRWIADSGILDLFLLLGPKPSDVMAQYARLTGPTIMPQVSGVQELIMPCASQRKSAPLDRQFVACVLCMEQCQGRILKPQPSIFYQVDRPGSGLPMIARSCSCSLWGTTSAGGITATRRTREQWTPASTSTTSRTTSSGWTSSTPTASGAVLNSCVCVHWRAHTNVACAG